MAENNKRNGFYKKNYPMCLLCKKPVKDLDTALYSDNTKTSDDTKTPVHFDCVVKKLRNTETLKRNEKICYLGKGSFGILTFPNYSHIPFLIRKRILYEV